MPHRTSVVRGDKITLIVPNADRLSARIANWSRGDPRLRLRVPVGLAYGSGLAFRERQG